VLVAVHHHLLDRRVGEQFLQRSEADGLAQDQLAEACPRGRLEDRGVAVDELADRFGQRVEPLSRGGLRAPALDQATAELTGQLVKMPATDALVHSGLSHEHGPLAPGRWPDRSASIAWRRG